MRRGSLAVAVVAALLLVPVPALAAPGDRPAAGRGAKEEPQAGASGPGGAGRAAGLRTGMVRKVTTQSVQAAPRTVQLSQSMIMARP